ncbi:ST7 protein [Desulfitobacterium sp. LBE]|uniref:tetratricopeptide repeat protein n=1 Tax=Desulfitobacterium sp. LBE TaxID=884086 RepID=UPI00119B9E7D|nr:tetratricopeptide repeat protein [Desulfitobacterium sp. LBE]TWH60285.1 ST7 protein [Desulfitobacterium sp. LBE]
MSYSIITEYSNQLHQLLVSVSQHLYFDKDGYVTYQKKPLGVNIKSCHKSRKEHLVYYVLRDHFSGTFTFQIATTKRLIPLADFLHYAWSEPKGEEKFIWGMPDSLFIPQMIASEELLSGLEALNVRPLHPPSGFASGVRVIRDIENDLCFFMRETVDYSLEGLNKLRFRVYQYLINSSHRDNKFSNWKAGLTYQSHPRTTPVYSDFVNFFPAADPKAPSPIPLNQVPKDKQLEKRTRKSKKATPDYPPFSEEKLSHAQELIYGAWEEPNRQKCLALARKALRVSPYCADAYNLLAEKCELLEERRELYTKGVAAGRMALGDSFFQEQAGHFWGYLETRPYMRALAGLSECLWKNGLRQEAIESYKELLRLNPNDNQGIRYILINCLLAEGLDGEAEKLLSTYPESSCFMLYSEALLSFRRLKHRKAEASLKEALLSNPHVPPYLLGSKHLPWSQPAYYSPGSIEEAVIYATDACTVWKNTPNALTWLAEKLKSIT